MDSREGGGYGKVAMAGAVGQRGFHYGPCLRLMSLCWLGQAWREAAQHKGWMASYPRSLEKETTLLKRPFFTFILLLHLTIADSVSFGDTS